MNPILRFIGLFGGKSKGLKSKDARQEGIQTWLEVTNERLCDFVTPGVQGIASSIARPTVDANNFELKPALVSMVQ